MIYLDMDGVLCDFMSACLKLHGDPEVNHAGTFWGVCHSLNITEEQFWTPINAAGSSFWADLNWTNDGKDILKEVEELFGMENVCLLSSPSHCPSSVYGKLEWIRRHVPAYSKRYLLGPDKGFVASSGRLLIDDGDHNIQKWVGGKGIAVRVPRPWNSEHEFSDSSLYIVRERLKMVVTTKQVVG